MTGWLLTGLRPLRTQDSCPGVESHVPWALWEDALPATASLLQSKEYRGVSGGWSPQGGWMWFCQHEGERAWPGVHLPCPQRGTWGQALSPPQPTCVTWQGSPEALPHPGIWGEG